jgi:hypothetical protein
VIYQDAEIAITYGETVGLYHVFILGLKPRSFPKIEDVASYIYEKTGRVIQFVSDKSEND